MRGIANTMHDWYWLKTITPFGWADKVSPVSNTELTWLVPFLLSVPIIAIGIYLVGKRDLAASLIKESENVRSRNFLLGSSGQLALRQQLGIFAGWIIAALGVSSLIAAIANIAASAAADAPGIKEIIGKLGGTIDDLEIAFLGTGMVFIALILLIMVTVGMSSIRKDEAKQYLDNLLVQPLKRSVWLTSRLGVLIAVSLIISLASGFATLFIGQFLGLHIDAGNLILVSIALTGTAIFTLGFGTLLYGMLPRFATALMYIVIAWSFVVDVLQSIIKLDDTVINSSLLHYISFSPNQAPNWGTFAWLVGLGIAMASIGIFAFTRRDIIAE
jgi:putative exporter of polyketide antibiotics